MTGSKFVSDFAQHTKLLFIESLRRLSKTNSVSGLITFPLLMGVISFALAYALVEILFVSVSNVLLVFSTLFLFVGVQTGLVFLVDIEIVNNYLSEDTLLHYVSRLYPISQRASLSAFFITETAMYTMLFIIPISIGTALGVGTPLTTLPLFTVMYGIMFLLGVGLLLILSSFRIYVSLLVLGGLSSAFFYLTSSILNLTIAQILPTGIVIAPNNFELIGLWAFISGLTLLIGFARQSTISSTDSNTSPASYSLITRALETEPHRKNYDSQKSAVVVRIFASISRSTGGFSKVFGTALLLWFVAYLLIDTLSSLFNSNPLYLLTILSVMAALSYMFYHMIVSNSSIEEYTMLPLDRTDVLNSEAYTFYVINLVSLFMGTVLTIVVAEVLFFEVVLSFLLLVGMIPFMYWFTAKICQHDTEALFHGKAYTLYSLGIIVLLLPLIMLGTLFTASPLLLTVFVVAIVTFIASRLLRASVLSEED